MPALDARLTIRLWHETLSALKRAAKREGRTLSQYVNRVLRGATRRAR